MLKKESGISKAEARDKLKKAGYNVIDDNSVVTVLLPPNESIKKAIKDIRELLLSWNYSSSFGVRHHFCDDEELEQDEPEESDIEQESREISGHDMEDTEAEPESLKGESRVMAGEDIGEKAEDFAEFDKNDLDMILNEDSIQMSFGDFGLN